MKKVLVIGTTCVDVILTIDHLPVTEEDLNPDSQTVTIGGCSFNTANLIRQAGVPVTLASPVGTGVYGDFVASHLQKTGFPVFVRPDQENGCCYCLVEKSGERTFLSYHGVEYSFRRSWMDNINPGDYAYIYFCGLEIEEPTGEALISYLEECRIISPTAELFFSPGPRLSCIQKDRIRRVLSLGPILHINRSELKALSGCDSLAAGMKTLQGKTGNTVITTLGAEGACFLEKSTDNIRFVPGYPAVVVDTIGAGDAHAGQLLASLCKGKSLMSAADDANRTSSRVVSVKGASLTDEQWRELNLS